MDELQTLDVEKHLLSALLTDGEKVMTEVAEMVSASDFIRSEHREIYSAILRMSSSNEPIQPLSVRNELDKTGRLKIITPQYFLSLTGLEYTSRNAVYYAKEVREASLKRQLSELGAELVKESKRQTSTETLSYLEKKLTKLSTSQQTTVEDVSDILIRAIENLTKSEVGLATRFRDLDRLTGGLKKSDLIILAARPSMGKTALALNIANNLSKSKSVLMFSLEMSKEQLMRRLLSSESGVPASRLGDNLNELEMRKLTSSAGGLSKQRLKIDDTGALSLFEMKTRARRLKREKGLDVIIIDYLQLMQASKEYRGNRVQEVSEISRGLKALAKELDVPVLALSQLSRAVEQRLDKRPVLSDLRESGSIEQDADIVMFLYREEYYNIEVENNTAEVIVAKNRNGATGRTKLYFDKETVTFRNLLKEVW